MVSRIASSFSINTLVEFSSLTACQECIGFASDWER